MSLPSTFSTSEIMVPSPSLITLKGLSLSLSLSLLHPQFLLPSSTHLSFLLFLCQTSYSVTLTGLIQNPRKLFIKDIRFSYMLLLSFLDTKYCIFSPSSLYIPPLFPQTAGPSQSTMLLLLYRFILIPLTLLYAHFFHMQLTSILYVLMLECSVPVTEGLP